MSIMDEWTADGVRLILGDCLKILPSIGPVDAVVTDPPYGIDYGNAGGFCESAGWNAWRGTAEWDKERPSKETFDAILSLGVPTAIWGGNYFTDYLPPSSKWLIWDKGQTDFTLADCEVAWCSWGGAIRRLMYPRAKALQDGKVHPTQKPIEVMRWNLMQLPKGCDLILDCFAGSGTTGVAAMRLGKRAILIERDAGYFEKAKERLIAEQSRTVLFDAPTKLTQRTILD